MEPSQLNVFQTPYTKIRIGLDKCCVICDIPDIQYDLLLSGSFSPYSFSNSSFETAFVQKYANTPAFLFAPANTNKDTESFIFSDKIIGYYENEKETNLGWLIENNSVKNVFVKLDVEGGEMPWIKSLTIPKLDKITQLVITFNLPFSDYDAFDIINQTHILIHIKPNNSRGVRQHKGVFIPNVFECTYIHKKYFSNPPELNYDPIPCPLDRNMSNDQIQLNYPPFVNVITNPNKPNDGFGENFKLLIYSVMFAELHGFKFIYTPFKEMEHNYMGDNDYLFKKEILVNFIGNYETEEKFKPYVIERFELLRFFSQQYHKMQRIQKFENNSRPVSF